jgi:hypothetical protein
VTDRVLFHHPPLRLVDEERGNRDKDARRGCQKERGYAVDLLIGAAVRFWLRSGGVDRRVCWSFGLTSAAGGLIGGVPHNRASNRWLNVVIPDLAAQYHVRGGPKV